MKKFTASKIVAGTLSAVMVLGCTPFAMAGEYVVKKVIIYQNCTAV